MKPDYYKLKQTKKHLAKQGNKPDTMHVRTVTQPKLPSNNFRFSNLTDNDSEQTTDYDKQIQEDIRQLMNRMDQSEVASYDPINYQLNLMQEDYSTEDNEEVEFMLALNVGNLVSELKELPNEEKFFLKKDIWEMFRGDEYEEGNNRKKDFKTLEKYEPLKLKTISALNSNFGNSQSSETLGPAPVKNSIKSTDRSIDLIQLSNSSYNDGGGAREDSLIATPIKENFSFKEDSSINLMSKSNSNVFDQAEQELDALLGDDINLDDSINNIPPFSDHTIKQSSLTSIQSNLRKGSNMDDEVSAPPSKLNINESLGFETKSERHSDLVLGSKDDLESWLDDIL